MSIRRGWYNRQSIAFDGVSKHLTAAAAVGHAIDRDSSLSVWTKCADNSTPRTIAAQYPGGTNRGWYFNRSSSKTLQFAASVDGTIGTVFSFNSFAVADWTVWHHVVWTWADADGAMCIYVDGALNYCEAKAQAGIFDSTAGVTIGNTAGSLFPWSGRLDDLSVWSVALTLPEVQALYTDGRARRALDHSQAANLAHYWRMGDGATYPTIPNLGTVGGDLTMTNMSAGDIVQQVPHP